MGRIATDVPYHPVPHGDHHPARVVAVTRTSRQNPPLNHPGSIASFAARATDTTADVEESSTR